jgi:hypothetical protein
MDHQYHQYGGKRTFIMILALLAAVAAAFIGCSDEEIYAPYDRSLEEKGIEQTSQYTFELGQNCPNPFYPATTIPFSIGEETRAVITIYNESGEVVWKIGLPLDDPYAKLVPDDYRISWAATDLNKEPLASGIYIYELVAGDFRDSKKMVLLK